MKAKFGRIFFVFLFLILADEQQQEQQHKQNCKEEAEVDRCHWFDTKEMDGIRCENLTGHFYCMDHLEIE
jgi:hypothetical protein